MNKIEELEAKLNDILKEIQILKDASDNDINDDPIDYIMDNFDFKKVHETMDFLNWEWCDSSWTYYVPSVDQLRDKAYKLLKDVADKLGPDKEKEFTIVTGGFHAKGWYDGKIYLELLFAVCSWDNFE